MALSAHLSTRTPCEIILKAHAGRDDLDAAYEKAYKRIAREVTLPGFRKGAAPRSLVEEHYRSHIREQALEDLMTAIIRTVIKKHDLKLCGGIRPQEEYTFPVEGDLDFTVECEIHPRVSLDHVEHVPLVKNIVDITDERLEELLTHMREKHATYEKISEERPAAYGDWAVVDYTGTVDGTQIFSRVGAWMEINSRIQFPLPGFVEQLAGCAIGETRTFSLEIPSSYHKEELQGKTAECTATLHELHEKVLPELTDELAHKIDPACETVDALKEALRTQATSYYEREERSRLAQLAREKLVQLHPLALPPSAVTERAKSIANSLARERVRGGESEEDVKKDGEKIVQTARDYATHELRAEYLLSALADRENITVTFEDIKPQIFHYARTFNRSPQWVYEQFSHDGHIDLLYQNARQEKALEWVIEHADITEKAGDK